MKESEQHVRRSEATLRDRHLPQGGFAPFPGQAFCPASTAWAILTLPQDHGWVTQARTALRRCILADGRLPILPDHPQAYWPTPVGLMALLGDASCATDANRLASFLLNVSGAHWPKTPDAPTDHDTNLRGWTWTEGAHSWAEPTATAMLALSAAGLRDHPRLRQARELLMDRQMPHGGWNYGNVRVFGTLLKPDMTNTSAALCALVGRAAQGTLARSLDTLAASAAETRAPLSLAWAVLALGSWGRDTSDLRDRLPELLSEHPVTGALDTGTLALGSIALANPDGLAAHLARRAARHDGQKAA